MLEEAYTFVYSDRNIYGNEFEKNLINTSRYL